jgi:hypothetical protein
VLGAFGGGGVDSPHPCSIVITAPTKINVDNRLNNITSLSLSKDTLY